jgi:hypothetical protein
MQIPDTFFNFIHFWSVTLVNIIKNNLIQQQEDQTNTKDNIPPIEEAMERKPYGLRIF